MPPAISKKQARMFRIAEHHPEALYERNKGAKEMSKEEMHKYASTKEEGLPLKKKLAKRKISKA